MTKSSLCKDPWAKLAEAIINDGVRTNDQLFLNSEWYEFLKDICDLDIEAQRVSENKSVDYLYSRGLR